MDNIIVNDYMKRKYPNKAYSIKQGNDCQWIMMDNINIYMIIRDNQIIRVDID